MKKLFLFFFALVVSIGTAWADKTIYFNPGVWATDNPAFAAYVWGTGGNTWIDLTTTKTVVGNTCYVFSVPDEYTTGMLFTRAETPEKAKNFDEKWNQTNDITPEGGLVDNTLYTITGWGAGDFTSTTINLAMLGTAIATSGIPNNAIDGNTGTRWESAFSDPQTWQVDLGEATTFNTISILWEGAYAKTFTIEVGDNVDGDGYLTGGTEIVNITDQSLTGGFPQKQTLRFDAKTARYIKFNGIARATGYGYSFWEFDVQNIESQTLGSLNLTVPNAARKDATLSACKVGENITINATALDTDNIDYSTEGISFTATNGTITNAGVFTPSAAGLCTITATLEDKEASVTIYAYAGDDLLLNKAATANEGASGTDLFTDGNWGNRGGLGAAVPAWAQYDLEAYYTIDFVMLKQEQANSKNYKIQFSHDGETWADAYERTNVAGMQGDVWDYFFGNTTQNTDVRFIRFYSTEAATQYGVSIYEIAAYGTKTGEVADNVAPVINTATVNATALGVTFTLKATDETASNISYTITDGTDVYNTSGANGTEITYTVYGMTAATHSNVTVIANDGHNDSEATILADFVVPALPDIPAITETETYLLWDGNDGGRKNGFEFYNWGSGQTGTNITINEKAAYQINNFRWYGSQFTEFDATPYDFLELDVYPSSETTTLAIVPINILEGNTNQNEKGQQFNLTPGEWNKLKINIADFIAENKTTMTKFYQIKFVGKVVNKGADGATDGFANGNGTETFVIGNIYAYKAVAQTVTFVNDGDWENVYAWAWKGTDGQEGYENFTGGTWPGEALVDNGDGTFTWSTTGDPEFILFNNGSDAKKTPDFPYIAGTTYNSTSIPASVGYYIVGTMNNWEINKNYKLTLNETAAPTVEYYFPSLTLTTATEFKVAQSSNGFSTTSIYPDGTGNAYGENGEITTDGNYVIFFRPNHDGGDDWFDKYIYVTSMIDAGVDPATGAHVLTGIWDAAKFASIDAMDKAAAYDLTGVDFTGVQKPINTAAMNLANPFSLFITSEPNTVNRNEVVWDATNNRYNGYGLYFVEEWNSNNNGYNIATNIAPIHVQDPFFQRLFYKAGYYVTMTVPFDYPSLPEGAKFYEMSAATTVSGATTITFTEVTSITKNKPYLVNCTIGGITITNAGEVTIDWADNETTGAAADFKNNYVLQTLDNDKTFVLPSGVDSEADIKFMRAAGATLRPFRAYLEVNDPAAKINVMIDDATGIHAATTEQLEGIFNIYSIDGKIVRQDSNSKVGLPQGIYIINGKKVVIK